jgi:hypothetical protein
MSMTIAICSLSSIRERIETEEFTKPTASLVQEERVPVNNERTWNGVIVVTEIAHVLAVMCT